MTSTTGTVGSRLDAARSRGMAHAGRLLGLQRGEAACVAWFFVYAFVLLVCYYQLRLLREPLLLTNGSAELKSYAQAVIAGVLMLLTPAYGVLFRRMAPQRLVHAVTGFFLVGIVAFYVLGTAGFDIGFAYYVWVGVFGVTMLAQFWAHTAHSLNVGSGQRLFPAVMTGATLGALVGAAIASDLFSWLGTWNLLLVAGGLLAATLPLVKITHGAVPPESRRRRFEDGAGVRRRGSFALVLGDGYLIAIAGVVVILNCVNTTGEYLLTAHVLRHTDALLRVDPALDRSELIATFYGGYYLMVNAVTVVLQLVLAGRLFRWLGVPGAILVLPIVALIGYGALVFFPVFTLIHWVKVAENGVDYSVMNTARHALFLPLPTAQQYQGKTAIDGFFWRLGDLVQAGVVYVGVNWMGFGLEQFAALNAILAIAWIALTARVAQQYRRQVAREARAPRAFRAGRLAAAALGLVATAATPLAAAERINAPAAAEPTGLGTASEAAPAASSLFATDQPLTLELSMDRKTFCRDPERPHCEDAGAVLLYHAADGAIVPIDVKVRSRGRWRNETGDCPLPALFVFFDQESAAGTPFGGQSMLPLTTHCRDQNDYEQYVLKEYLAYRIYNLLTTKSLRVRLARITYRDFAHPGKATTRFGFFTEHFDSLAARNLASVWHAGPVDVAKVDPQELATFALFQYMIGNTDWSAVYGHNTVALHAASGALSVVPYDFDFSGLVEAAYAGPAPQLPIRSVRQRLFRGFCTPTPDWDAVFAAFAADRESVAELLADVPGLARKPRERASSYLDEFFASLQSPAARTEIAAGCRPR
jgi:AAA family ATP:ADP antiporter